MTTNSRPHVCISVLNWNNAPKTIQCLKSLQSLNYPDFHVIVVDNGSADDSVDIIRTTFPDIEMICAEENLGYAGGNKLALQHALKNQQTDLFWILNNDVTTMPETLTALVNAYFDFGDWALYGSVQIQPESQEDVWRAEMRLSDVQEGSVIPHNRRKVSGERFDILFPTTEPRITGTLTGSSLLIPLALVRKYGYMRTDFFLYSEEGEYIFRLRALGIPSILVPASVIAHQMGSSHRRLARLKPLILYYQTRNHLIVWRQYACPPVYFGMLLKHAANAVKWILVAPFRGRIAVRSAGFILLGIWHALRNRTGKTFAPENWVKNE